MSRWLPSVGRSLENWSEYLDRRGTEYLEVPRPRALWGAFVVVLVTFCVVWPWQHSTLPNPASLASGLSVIPADVRAMRVLATRHDVRRFWLASELVSGPEVPILAAEHLYPVRLSPDASEQFVRRGAAVSPACVVVDSEGGISLLECRR